MSRLHDPTFEIRRVFWLVYGALAVGLILYYAATVIGQHAGPSHRLPSTAGLPNSVPGVHGAAIRPSPSDHGVAGAGRSSQGPADRSTAAGFAPGEPPGDVEDEPRGSSTGGGSTGGTAPGPGTVPGVALPVPSVPALPHVAPSAAVPRVLPSVSALSLLPSPPVK